MLEYKGDILKLIGEVDAICITTNLFVKSNGRAVMGRGIARAINTLMPGTDIMLGSKIIRGSKVDIVAQKEGTDIISFPVKTNRIKIESEYDLDNIVSHMRDKFKVGDIVPGWACKANPRMIQDSCSELVWVADAKDYKTVYLPRPGCGAGELEYEDVKPILSKILDDRFYVSTF